MSSLKKTGQREWEMFMESWTTPLGSGVRMPLIDTHIFAVLPITSPATVPKAWFLATGKNKISKWWIEYILEM